MSDFLLAREEKNCIFSALSEHVGIECLAPLTVIISGEVDSSFAFSLSTIALIEDRVKTML